MSGAEDRSYQREEGPVYGMPVDSSYPQPQPQQPLLHYQQNVPYTYTEVYAFSPQGRGTAVASFVISLLGLAFAFLFPVLAVILGYAALAKLDPVDPFYDRYRTYAVSGITIGFVTVLANMILFIVLGATGVFR